MRAAAFAGLAALAAGISLLFSMPSAKAQSPDAMCRAIVDAQQRQSCFEKIKPKQALPVTRSSDCTASDPDRKILGCTQIINDGNESQQNHAIAFYNRGLAYQDKLDYDRAIADYSEAIRIGDGAEPFNNRGNLYHARGDLERAIADYTEAIRLNPQIGQAFYNRGLTYFDKKDFDRAIADLTNAIRLDPENADAFNTRGNAYSSKGEYKRAIADFTQAIQLNPKLAFTYLNRSFPLFQTGATDRALADLNEAIRLNPNDPRAYNQRALTYQALGDLEHARADQVVAKALANGGRPPPSQQPTAAIMPQQDGPALTLGTKGRTPKDVADETADRLKGCVASKVASDKSLLLKIDLAKEKCREQLVEFMHACQTFFLSIGHTGEYCDVNAMNVIQSASPIASHSSTAVNIPGMIYSVFVCPPYAAPHCDILKINGVPVFYRSIDECKSAAAALTTRSPIKWWTCKAKPETPTWQPAE